jgi:hypothetical protein
MDFDVWGIQQFKGILQKIDSTDPVVINGLLARQVINITRDANNEIELQQDKNLSAQFLAVVLHIINTYISDTETLKSILEITSNEGHTLLCVAACMDNLAAVKLFIEYGTTTHSQELSDTILNKAIKLLCIAAYTGSVSILKFLLSTRLVGVNQPASVEYETVAKPPLLWAVVGGTYTDSHETKYSSYKECIWLLLEHGASLSYHNIIDDSLLHIIAGHIREHPTLPYTPFVELLLLAGAQSTAQNYFGVTATDIAPTMQLVIDRTEKKVAVLIRQWITRPALHWLLLTALQAVYSKTGYKHAARHITSLLHDSAGAHIITTLDTQCQKALQDVITAIEAHGLPLTNYHDCLPFLVNQQWAEYAGQTNRRNSTAIHVALAIAQSMQAVYTLLQARAVEFIYRDPCNSLGIPAKMRRIIWDLWDRDSFLADKLGRVLK